MLLPPMAFPAVDGLAVYPAQPSLRTRPTDGATCMTASRVDSATYMLQQPGDYVLPAIDVGWWNARDGRVETAHLDAVATAGGGQSGGAKRAAAAAERAPRLDVDRRFRCSITGSLAILDPGHRWRCSAGLRRALRARSPPAPSAAPRGLSSIRSYSFDRLRDAAPRRRCQGGLFRAA